MKNVFHALLNTPSRLLTHRGEFQVASAGVRARPGAQPAFGVDLTDHRSRALDVATFSTADLVIGMEAWHGAEIRRRFPEILSPSALLSRFEDGDDSRGGYLRFNIPDPYGRNLEAFGACFARIESCLKGLCARRG